MKKKTHIYWNYALKKLYPNTLICYFLIGGVKISTIVTLKLIIQGLLWSYNKYVFSNLTNIKVLLMVSTSKIAFNIDGLTIHSTFNIHIQHSLFKLLTYHHIH
jgi:hypothetical protein